MKNLIALTLTIILAACGSSGGGGSSTKTETRSPSPENQLGINLSVPSFSTSTTGVQGSPFYLGRYYIRNVRLRNIHIGGEHSANFLEGDTTVLSEAVDFRAYRHNASDSWIFHVEGNREISIGTYGADFISVPSGKHTYSGINTGISKEYGEWEGIGSFAMNVDFDNKNGYLKGSTTFTRIGEQNWTSEIEGGFTINTTRGVYSATDLKLRVDSAESLATISGNFHGRNALGVTGEYTGLGNNSDITGAIAGSRDSVLTSADPIN